MPIINHEMTIEEAWGKVLSELNAASKNPGHAFRYLSLATVDAKDQPSQRMVVLRKFSQHNRFTIYTDARSGKVEDLIDNNSVSLLFYDHDQKLQVTVKGSAKVLSDGEGNLNHWTESGSKGTHSYTSVKSPGEVIQKPDEAYEWNLEDSEHFCVIHIESHSMEFLQLDGHRHLRSFRELSSNGSWKERWIAP
ncbi:MAG: hypothetical protein CL670_02600 [Balneola sp.]|nr:hypothetical protein [Balneola sp.]MBE78023.1 hypothetical protein [Balneola sp.]|tara:strand:- start:2348 stop:2926 length:579 start_codon:yes stop_codon:yes gene_type:complete